MAGSKKTYLLSGGSVLKNRLFRDFMVLGADTIYGQHSKVKMVQIKIFDERHLFAEYVWVDSPKESSCSGIICPNEMRESGICIERKRETNCLRICPRPVSKHTRGIDMYEDKDICDIHLFEPAQHYACFLTPYSWFQSCVCHSVSL